MSQTKANRAYIATFVALCLLFAQLATAVYACPLTKQKFVPAASHATVSMADCDAMSLSQMGKDQPNLCKAYCQAGQQLHDPKADADLPASTLNVFWLLIRVLAPLPEQLGRDFFIAHAPNRPPGSAPIYLVNQVFRL